HFQNNNTSQRVQNAAQITEQKSICPANLLMRPRLSHFRFRISFPVDAAVLLQRARLRQTASSARVYGVARFRNPNFGFAGSNYPLRQCHSSPTKRATLTAN